MSKVILAGYILVPESELAVVQAALSIHIKNTLAEPGCLSFKVQQDPDDELKFHVNETFINQQAFEHHQNRVQDSDWGLVSKNVARHYQTYTLAQ